MLEALSLLLMLARSAEPLDMGPDLAGPYCAQIDKCCEGRMDECAMPILGTLCYCDTFCNRTVNPDCCPDYFSHCRGMHFSVAPTLIFPPAKLRGTTRYLGLCHIGWPFLFRRCSENLYMTAKQKSMHNYLQVKKKQVKSNSQVDNGNANLHTFSAGTFNNVPNVARPQRTRSYPTRERHLSMMELRYHHPGTLRDRLMHALFLPNDVDN